MGEMVEFASNGGTGHGLPRQPRRAARARCPRDPGVVGPRAPHQGRLRPLRRRGLRRPGPRPLPRGQVATEPDEAGKLMMALNLEQAGKDLSGAVDLLAGAQRPGRRRRRRLLHGRRPGPRARHAAARRRQGGRAVLRRDPVAVGPARLVEARRQGRSATTPRWTASSRPEKAQELEDELKGLGKDVEFFVYQDVDHAFFNDTRPEVYDADDVAGRPGTATAGALPPARGCSSRRHSLRAMSARTRDLPRRSCLSIPGSSEKMLGKGPAHPGRHGLPRPRGRRAPRWRRRRPGARSSTPSRTRTGATRSLCVRVNDWDTQWTAFDVIEVVGNAGERLDEIMLPKVESAAQVVAIDLAPHARSRPHAGLPVGHIGIEAQIETARGLINVEEICAASPRLETIIFGPADFAASMEMPVLTGGVQIPEYPGDHFHYVFSKILMAGPGQRAAGHRRAVPLDPRPRRLPRLLQAHRRCSATTASGRCTPTRSPS